MSNYYIEAKSRGDLRAIAYQIRVAFGLENQVYFPIVKFMEHMMEVVFDNYEWEIIKDDELPPHQDAVTEMENGKGTVKIKESVYYGACEGNGQHRMTIAHEIIGHFIPICVLGFKLYHSTGNEKIKQYCDPEWQAKCLAGEFMMPYHLVKDYTPNQLVKECGVSKAAAECQRNVFRKETTNEKEKRRLF